MDLLEHDEEQDAGNARTHGRFGDGQVGRLQKHPHDAHQHAVGHVDDHAHQQFAGETGGDGADEQEAMKALTDAISGGLGE